MRKLLISIILSILCALGSTTFAIESDIQLASREIALEPVSPQALTNTQENIGMIRKTDPELSDSQLIGTSTSHYYLIKPSSVNNKNYFSYRGDNVVDISDEIVAILDSVTNVDSLYLLLNEMSCTFSEYTNVKMNQLSIEYKKFQREKQIEAIAYLLWPFLLIICLIFLSIYYEVEVIRHPLLLLSIALLIGTLITLPDIIMMFKGIDYSVINNSGG